MTKFEQIKETYKGIYGSIDLDIDGTHYHFIDIDSNTLEGYKWGTAGCGCCSEYVDVQSDISYELEYIDDLDFQDFISELEKLKK